ncbi:MAG: hypothetical protein H6745_24910 [Deltaproteobacteria bacterium]|nr:hypothetical protein [Deltaproteobacteria bacterium]
MPPSRTGFVADTMTNCPHCGRRRPTLERDERLPWCEGCGKRFDAEPARVKRPKTDERERPRVAPRVKAATAAAMQAAPVPAPAETAETAAEPVAPRSRAVPPSHPDLNLAAEFAWSDLDEDTLRYSGLSRGRWQTALKLLGVAGAALALWFIAW